jgi:hypothetical protein
MKRIISSNASNDSSHAWQSINNVYKFGAV